MELTEEQRADPATLARCAAGCGAALELLYERYASSCLAHARSVLRDAGHAEDAVQEAFLDLWRHAERYDSRHGSVRTWLLMLTHRRAVDRVRAEQRRRASALPADDRPDEGPPADERALDLVLGEQARAALADLTYVKREVLVLAYWGGRTQREIAVLTGAPLGTVKTRMHSALTDLSARLCTQPVDDDGDAPARRRPEHGCGPDSQVYLASR